MELDDLLKKYREYSQQDTTIIEYAWHFAEEAHKNQKRASGEKYFVHCASVADILTDSKMDAKTICAGLLHDVLEDTDITDEKFKEEFGDEIYNLVKGVTKIDSLKFSSRGMAQIENWRKMILATAKDIRVIVIKLADRLNNMRTLEHLPREKQIRISDETLSLYAPLAQRLGIYQLKSELEDLAFKYLYPTDFEDLKTKVEKRYAAREKLLTDFTADLEKYLAETKIPHRILARTKNLYSIYRKMMTQQKPYEEIQDSLGVRIITDTIMNCYALLGILHASFKPVAGSFTDYISVPKTNLYQSLHTSVMPHNQGDVIEIQIRTEEMHRTAEYGIAAHWRYKLGEKGSDRHLDEKLNWLRQWIEYMQDLSTPREFIESFKTDLEMEQVFVFTPRGDVKTLPVGSTPVDFAYAVHTNIGNSCIGAKVNNKMIKLDAALKSGDRCEILTRKNSRPSKAWLEFVKTPVARSNIRKYMREHPEADK